MPSFIGSPYTHTHNTNEPALREAGSHFCANYGVVNVCGVTEDQPPVSSVMILR